MREKNCASVKGKIVLPKNAVARKDSDQRDREVTDRREEGRLK